MTLPEVFEGVEKIIHKLGRWKPNDLAFILSLAWDEQLEDRSVLVLIAAFQKHDLASRQWPCSDEPWFRVELRFTGVTNLHLNGVGPGRLQVTGFDIADISESAWEGVRFRVEDYEDDKIAFFCSRVEVLDVTEMPHFST